MQPPPGHVEETVVTAAAGQSRALCQAEYRLSCNPPVLAKDRGPDSLGTVCLPTAVDLTTDVTEGPSGARDRLQRLQG